MRYIGRKETLIKEFDELQDLGELTYKKQCCAIILAFSIAVFRIANIIV